MRAHNPVLLLFLAVACGKKELPPPPPPPAASTPLALSIKAVTLGKALGADQKVVDATDVFGAKDAIYAGVETEGAGDRARLEAKWTFFGAKGPIAVHANAMDLVGLTDPTNHEFHITNKSKSGWPKGAYQVEFFLNGVSATKKSFTVK